MVSISSPKCACVCVYLFPCLITGIISVKWLSLPYKLCQPFPIFWENLSGHEEILLCLETGEGSCTQDRFWPVRIKIPVDQCKPQKVDVKTMMTDTQSIKYISTVIKNLLIGC